MNVAYLCLGGNIGNREASMAAAITKINQLAGTVILSSPLYETEAWGVSGQQAYLNCCVGIETTLPAQELILVLLGIEKELGRSRNTWQTYEPRTIDIDILFYSNEVIDSEHLIVPHPRLHLRQFVLVPLHAIAADLVHPVLHQSVSQLLADCKDESSVTLFR